MENDKSKGQVFCMSL
uniref:Uncharacterized protein n=1 Tax=Lepeophtheirus salmonis TaxID=72036 RepID=A0A0K2UUL6_LEPSM